MPGCVRSRRLVASLVVYALAGLPLSAARFEPPDSAVADSALSDPLSSGAPTDSSSFRLFRGDSDAARGSAACVQLAPSGACMLVANAAASDGLSPADDEGTWFVGNAADSDPSIPPSRLPAAIPEPGSQMLVGIALIVAAMIGRLRNRPKRDPAPRPE